MEGTCKHFIVSGQVQGVCFRSATQTKARELNLTGRVRNTETGDVEVIACGVVENVTKLEEWLHQGPTFARVIKVTVNEMPFQEFQHFEVI